MAHQNRDENGDLLLEYPFELFHESNDLAEILSDSLIKEERNHPQEIKDSQKDLRRRVDLYNEEKYKIEK